ncbi:hypothetical protein BJP36_39145 [Moorena producens JHB]|uniref:Uncharacterized protein n=1 Tax=Moorena producens (strain JHB) TaxID=1454205 RepID=A0A9Q9UWP6_MOOP1|nr:hypothetical protein [Moorena producens]WAN70081.1 hypothetical protein BJP36_39145 [Moorena producens JHB]
MPIASMPIASFPLPILCSLFPVPCSLFPKITKLKTTIVHHKL